MKTTDITVEMLRERFLYDPETGEILSLKRRRPLGCLGGSGYWRVKVGGALLQAHRVAMALTTGSWPAGQVDHIDGDRRNNRITNLRACSPKENSRNAKRRVDNTSGLTGVSWTASRKKWRAFIRINGRNTYLGLFANKDEAARIYADASVQHRGEFTPAHVAKLVA